MGVKEDQALYYRNKADSIRYGRGCLWLLLIGLVTFLIGVFLLSGEPTSDQSGDEEPLTLVEDKTVSLADVRTKYGEPDIELGVAGSPVHTNPDTGYAYDKRWLYYLDGSADPKNPDKRIVFITQGKVTGIAVFYNDGKIVKESIERP